MHGQPYLFLAPGWYDTFESFKHNPSVTGFLVEEIIVDKISAACVRAVDIPSFPITPYIDSMPAIRRDKDALYLPVKFDERAISAIFIDVIHPKPATKAKSTTKAKSSTQAESSAWARPSAKVTATQIKVAKGYSDTESKFFTKWAEKLVDFKEAEVTFLWIVEHKREVKEVEERMNLKKLSNKDVLFNPSYNCCVISLDQVDDQLARTDSPGPLIGGPGSTHGIR